MNDGHVGHAELVLAGAIHTMDPARPTAEAVAVREGRIDVVGTLEEVRVLAGPRTEVIDLPGSAVLPGFQDAHVHPAFAGLDRLRCNLEGMVDRDAYRRAVRAYAESHPDVHWILGGGWRMEAFPGGTPGTKDIDDVVSDRPVFLTNADGHGAWVNSRALAAAGITSGTPDPPDGRIERDPSTGTPTGTLHEGAMDLVEDHAPEPTGPELEAGVLEGQRHLHSLGVTGWQDAWVDQELLRAYRAVDGRAELTGTVVAALWWERDRGVEQIDGLLEQRRWGTRGRVRATTVKIMLDGVCENFTASMLEPYLDRDGRPTANLGLRFLDPDVLNDAVTRLHRERFQVHFHAIGDRAVRDALDAVEVAIRTKGPRDLRHHIAHLQVVDPTDVPRFAALGVVANAQTFWACHEPQMDDLTIPFLGAVRSAYQYPFASIARTGGTLACGSDWAVSTADPLQQMEVAVTRVDPDHRGSEPLIPEERLSLDAALRGFTTGSAYVNGREGATGTIEPGEVADLVVLDRDPLAEGAGPVGDARVAFTIVEGRVVHEAP